MGTVTLHPAAIPPELLDMTQSELRVHMADLAESMVLDTLRTVPECVALTLRREVGGTCWDITLGTNYYRAEDGSQLALYVWDAIETTIGVPDEELPDFPNELLRRESYESPEEALHAALDALAEGG